MPAIEQSALGTIADKSLLELIIAAPVMPLNDAGADRATSRSIEEWLAAKPEISTACVAGLWLLAGDLDRSHTISQQLETSEGSYWHGIMHRREGDYFNAKYWMRRTGRHAVTEQLSASSSHYGDALAFADFVERAVTRDHSLRSTALHLQWLEWQLLFAACW